MIRVKICGITSPEDALLTAVAGADAIGLVFYAKSPRNVDVEQAQAILAALPPFVSTVGLFVNETPGRVRDIISRCPLDILQFHGEETPDYCASFGRPYLKALRMHSALDPMREMARHPQARGFLLDAYSPLTAGGTGERFDWARMPRESSRPLILAGGLGPDNVADAVRMVQPYGVDVSSGVESRLGVKDANLVRRFVDSARQARV